MRSPDLGRERDSARNERPRSGWRRCLLIEPERHSADEDGLALWAPGLGERSGGYEDGPALPGIDPAKEVLDRSFDARGQLVPKGTIQVFTRLVVKPREVVGPGELEPHAREPGPERKDRLEPLHRLFGYPQAERDLAKEEEPLDPFLLVPWLRLLEERPCVLEPTGPDEEPSGLHVRELSRKEVSVMSGLGVRPDRDHEGDRGQGARECATQGPTASRPRTSPGPRWRPPGWCTSPRARPRPPPHQVRRTAPSGRRRMWRLPGRPEGRR